METDTLTITLDAKKFAQAWLSVWPAASTKKSDTERVYRTVRVEYHQKLNIVVFAATNNYVALMAIVDSEPDRKLDYKIYETLKASSPTHVVLLHDEDAAVKSLVSSFLKKRGACETVQLFFDQTDEALGKMSTQLLTQTTSLVLKNACGDPWDWRSIYAKIEAGGTEKIRIGTPLLKILGSVPQTESAAMYFNGKFGAFIADLLGGLGRILPWLPRAIVMPFVKW